MVLKTLILIIFYTCFSVWERGLLPRSVASFHRFATCPGRLLVSAHVLIRLGGLAAHEKDYVLLMALPVNSCQSNSIKVNAMGLRKSVKKAMTYLLGVVDEYWAMREPGQYGEKEPECPITVENQACASESASH